MIGVDARRIVHMPEHFFRGVVFCSASICFIATVDEGQIPVQFSARRVQNG
jgi:hypothetical protein